MCTLMDALFKPMDGLPDAKEMLSFCVHNIQAATYRPSRLSKQVLEVCT